MRVLHRLSWNLVLSFYWECLRKVRAGVGIALAGVVLIAWTNPALAAPTIKSVSKQVTNLAK